MGERGTVMASVTNACTCLIVQGDLKHQKLFKMG